MKFHRTKDANVIRSIATHPKIWATLGDDLTPSAEAWQPVLHDGIYYLLAFERSVLCGMFIFFPENSISWQIHICMYPEAWGKGTRAMRDVFAFIWQHTACRRITGSVPVWNAPAIHCALRAGMKPFGVNQHSALKNGRLHHQLLVGISKPDGKAA